MRWLEGWFGTLSGGLGALLVAIAAIFVPAYSQSQMCSSIDGQTSCSVTYGPGAPPPTIEPNIAALILVALTLLFFIGVLLGTWLDLRGRRRVGRLMLLICASLLIFTPFLLLTSASNTFGGSPFMWAYPFVILALITGILACVRRDEPRVAATPPGTPVSAQE
jgi:MFS-type transporter involved in bile tolerance (Atg22 family)